MPPNPSQTQTIAPTRQLLPNRQLRLLVVSGPDAGLELVAPTGRATVGRGATADLRLSDPTVSQFHAEFRAAGLEIAVTDLGSRNGTRVGTVRLSAGLVPARTEVSVGSTTVRVELAPGEAVAEAEAAGFGGLVGASPAMRGLYAQLERLAPTELPVLLEGETGTGKEVAARALHAASARARGPFVVLDCTAVPPTLAESVLFGHEKGAFTGASERRAGIFEAAAGGTVFLDEVGELPLELQPKLLRVLERRELTRVGAARVHPVDVRIVSATWRDLRAMINRGVFREDLYYRLAYARVRIPALAERRDDVPALVQHFLARLPAGAAGARAVAADTLAALMARDYPGNVRELLATVERAALVADGTVITLADLAFERTLAAEATRARPELTDMGAALAPFRAAKQTTIDEFERAYLARLLERAGANISRAAALAGISRVSLRELLRRHGLRED